MSKKNTVLLATIAVVLIGAVLLILAGGPQVLMGRIMGGIAAPADLDTAVSRLTDQGNFKLTYSSSVDPVPVNQIHSWTVHVESAGGQPLEQAEITVDGGMPQHGHGLPTEPQVTQNLGGGDYLVEGMKFNMPGWWEVKFQVTTNGQSDSVTFNLVLK